MIRKLTNWTRDWRFRTIMPVVVIHLAAFAGLYFAMGRFAEMNLLNHEKFGAEALLIELEANFQDSMIVHGGSVLWERLSGQAQRHHLNVLNVFDSSARPFVSMQDNVPPEQMGLAREALAKSGSLTSWSTDESKGVLLIGTHPIDNGPACQGCHTREGQYLGAIQMGVNVTDAMAAARKSVRRKFATVGVAWIGLVVFMVWIRRRVIGRPLEQIEKSISAAGSGGLTQAHDLEALASQLNETLWDLIQQQRQREENMAKTMVRAEQLASLGYLAAGLTHEIKNPLAGVIAALDLLNSEEESATANREIYDQMLGELRRVTATIESLLRLAKPQPPQRTDVDMARVVREISSLFAARLRRVGVELEVDVSDGIPTLPLDPGLMAQLLVNLLTNSMQATDRGGRVKILLAPFPHRDGVILAVSDTGKGIDREHLDRIFDPFFTTKEEGTGLGLAICRQIVEQHGGTMSAESEVGKGTRFVVLLPSPKGAATSEVSDGAVAVG